MTTRIERLDLLIDMALTELEKVSSYGAEFTVDGETWKKPAYRKHLLDEVERLNQLKSELDDDGGAVEVFTVQY